jgi:hypothetical protein
MIFGLPGAPPAAGKLFTFRKLLFCGNKKA